LNPNRGGIGGAMAISRPGPAVTPPLGTMHGSA
jgi:hypothetical protein